LNTSKGIGSTKNNYVYNLPDPDIDYNQGNILQKMGNIQAVKIRNNGCLLPCAFEDEASRRDAFRAWGRRFTVNANN
jgi:hypothetical protein